MGQKTDAHHGKDHRWNGADPSGPVRLNILCTSQSEALATGDAQPIVEIDSDLDGARLVKVRASVTTVSSSGLPTVQIRNVTQAVDMLSTKASIDVGETSSRTATTAAVIDTANNTVADGDQIAIDVDIAGTGTMGLIVLLWFGR